MESEAINQIREMQAENILLRRALGDLLLYAKDPSHKFISYYINEVSVVYDAIKKLHEQIKP